MEPTREQEKQSSRSERRNHRRSAGLAAGGRWLLYTLLRLAVFAAAVTAVVYLLLSLDAGQRFLRLPDMLPAQLRDIDDRVGSLAEQLAATERRLAETADQTSVLAARENILALRDELSHLRRQWEPLLEALERALVDGELPTGQIQTDDASFAQADLKVTEAGSLLALQSTVLKARVELADGNRGRSRQELAWAAQLAARARQLAADGPESDWWGTIEDELERVRLELGLATPTAADRLELLWHSVYTRWLENAVD